MSARLVRGRYGTAAFVGAPKQPVCVDTSMLMRNGNTMTGSFWFAPETLQRLFELIQNGHLDLSPFSTARFGLAETGAAVDRAQTRVGGLQHTVLTSKECQQ